MYYFVLHASLHVHLGALSVAVASSNDFFLLKMGGACMFNLRHPHAQCVHPPSIAKRLNFQAIRMQRAIIVQPKILSAAHKMRERTLTRITSVVFPGPGKCMCILQHAWQGCSCLLRQKWGAWRHKMPAFMSSRLHVVSPVHVGTK